MGSDAIECGDCRISSEGICLIHLEVKLGNDRLGQVTGGTQGKEISGNELFREVTALTGLPLPKIEQELQFALAQTGASPESMSLEDLRRAVLCYMIQVFEQDAPSDSGPEGPSAH